MVHQSKTIFPYFTGTLNTFFKRKNMNVPFGVLKLIALLCKVTFLWFTQDLFSSSKTVKSKATSLPTSQSMTKAPLSLFDDDEEVSTAS